MKIVLSSRIWTNPGGSPRGETSARPLSPLVPMQRNGERSMNALQCLSSEGMHFFVRDIHGLAHGLAQVGLFPVGPSLFVPVHDVKLPVRSADRRH